MCSFSLWLSILSLLEAIWPLLPCYARSFLNFICSTCSLLFRSSRAFLALCRLGSTAPTACCSRSSRCLRVLRSNSAIRQRFRYCFLICVESSRSFLRAHFFFCLRFCSARSTHAHSRQAKSGSGPSQSPTTAAAATSAKLLRSISCSFDLLGLWPSFGAIVISNGLSLDFTHAGRRRG